MNINLNRKSKKISRLENSFTSIPFKSKSYKRGPYRAYEPSLKSKAIQMMTEDGLDFRVVAKSLGVPSKNVKRWLKVGPYRKKGLLLYICFILMWRKVYFFLSFENYKKI